MKNPMCADLGLEGACCPTADENWGFLDCCSTFPDECASGVSEDCKVTSAEDYKLSVGGTSGASCPSALMVGSALALVLAALSL